MMLDAILSLCFIPCIGFVPDENKILNLHPPLFGDASRQSRANSRCADALESHMKFKDRTGTRFNRLTVVELAGRSKIDNRFMWKCICDCGTVKILPVNKIVSGNTKSCGCLKREHSLRFSRTHGHTSEYKTTSEYNSWRGMRARCLEKGNISYKHYGGRGIFICQRWSDSFENFLEDMGPKPSPKHSIDRIDGNGNYEPGNCRWVDGNTQNNNSSNCHYITFQGQTKSMKEWARSIGIGYTTLAARINTRKWTIERAFLTPVEG